MTVTSKAQFVNAVGAVNADIEHRGPRGIIYRTKYREVALRVASLAKSANANVLETVTDDGLYVVGIRSLYAPKGARGIWGNG